MYIYYNTSGELAEMSEIGNLCFSDLHVYMHWDIYTYNYIYILST